MNQPLRYLCLAAGGLLGSALAAQAQARAPGPAHLTISGYVRDAASGESLPGVTVVHPATGLGTATNTYGFYSLTLPTAGLDSVRLAAQQPGLRTAALGHPRHRQPGARFPAAARRQRAGQRGGGGRVGER